MYMVALMKDNLPEDIIYFGDKRRLAQNKLLYLCSSYVSNWDEYTEEDKESILDDGYENLINGKTIVMFDLTNWLSLRET